MASQTVDIEKAEGGFQTPHAKQANVSIEEPSSPKSSQVETLIGSPSLGSHGKLGTEEKAPGIWTRWARSLQRVCRMPQWLRPQHTPDGYRNDSIIRKIHEQPMGYPRLATFLDSDENFMTYRRFGYLQSRLLLEKQDELRYLERDLEMLEEEEDPRRLKSRRRMSDEKKALFEKIESTWKSYCELLSKASDMVTLNKPTSIEQSSVFNWLRITQAIPAEEAAFIRCKEDLVILRPGREHAWLDAGVEKMLRWFGRGPVRRAFQSADTRIKTDPTDETVLYTRTRIENFVVSIITLFILALLVVPIWFLYKLSESDPNNSKTSFECIGVLLVSTLAFSACLSLFTRARRHEVLAASAGYCAVLVVFIGNIGNIQSKT